MKEEGRDGEEREEKGTFLHGLQILQPQLCRDDGHIAHRINVAFNMLYAQVCKATHHMEEDVTDADMVQKGVA
jgi:hypothetical protein